jgi:hypothetical protein
MIPGAMRERLKIVKNMGVFTLGKRQKRPVPKVGTSRPARNGETWYLMYRRIPRQSPETL